VIRVGGATEVEVKEKKDRVTTRSTPPAPRWKRAWFRAAGRLLRAKRAVGALKNENEDVQADQHRAQALESPIRQMPRMPASRARSWSEDQRFEVADFASTPRPSSMST